jgi:glycosyltransferase involved in cell wall biosynthesis
LTPPGDAEGIAGAIADLARDVEKRDIMGRNALQRAKNFTVDACVEGLEKVYATIRRKLPIAFASEKPSSEIATRPPRDV